MFTATALFALGVRSQAQLIVLMWLSGLVGIVIKWFWHHSFARQPV